MNSIVVEILKNAINSEVKEELIECSFGDNVFICLVKESEDIVVIKLNEDDNKYYVRVFEKNVDDNDYDLIEDMIVELDVYNKVVDVSWVGYDEEDDEIDY